MAEAPWRILCSCDLTCDVRVFLPHETQETTAEMLGNLSTITWAVSDHLGFKHRAEGLKSMSSFHYVWKTLSPKKTGSLLLALALLRNISSHSLLLYLRQKFFKLEQRLFPLTQRLLFNQLFSLESLQGIPSTKTLGTGKQQVRTKRQNPFKMCFRSGGDRHCFC